MAGPKGTSEGRPSRTPRGFAPRSESASEPAAEEATKVPHPITVMGTLWFSDCKRAKRFLGDQQVEYKWVDVEHDEEARRFVEQHNDGKTIIPTILFDDGTILVEPSNAQLAQKLGLPTMAQHRFYDLIVVGGGPAGLTAACYASREGLSTLVLDRSSLRGQAALTDRLENYPRFPAGLT